MFVEEHGHPRGHAIHFHDYLNGLAACFRLTSLASLRPQVRLDQQILPPIDHVDLPPLAQDLPSVLQ